MIADYWRGMSTINGKASAIGNAEVFLGDYQRAFSLPEELRRLTQSGFRPSPQTCLTAIDDRRRVAFAGGGSNEAAR